MNSIPNSAGFTLTGGKIGVLVIHGFTGSPVSVKPWAEFFNQIGYTVSTPCLPGHGTSWQEMNETTWQQWYEKVEKSFIDLQSKCDRVFVAGFSMGAALALKLSQIRGSEIEGLILLNASVQDRRFILKLTPLLKYLIPSIKKGPTDIAKPNPPKHSYDRTPLKALDSLRKLWTSVEKDLYLVDLPLLVAYSIHDHAVDPESSFKIVDKVSSVDIREVVFEKSFHNVPLDYDLEKLNIESKLFIEDVLAGNLRRGLDLFEGNLIDTQFDSIVSGLSLDQSAPTTYLDELDNFQMAERFTPPNPKPIKLDSAQRFSISLFFASSAYLVAYLLSDFEIFGSWPAVLGILGSIATIIWRTARSEDNFDDGTSL